MLRRSHPVLLAMWLALSASVWAGATETLDRIVVVVNKNIILASEWEQAVRYEALLEGKPLAQVTDSDCEQALGRLIDQQLLQQQIDTSNYLPVSDAELERRTSEVRRQLAPRASDAEWLARLAAYGLTADDVRERIAAQLNILRFIELRFRPTIHIDRRNIESYYRETLLPQLGAANSQPPTLQAASPQIEEVLVQQRIDELLAAYLKNLRAQAGIRRHASAIQVANTGRQ